MAEQEYVVVYAAAYPAVAAAQAVLDTIEHLHSAQVDGTKDLIRLGIRVPSSFISGDWGATATRRDHGTRASARCRPFCLTRPRTGEPLREERGLRGSGSVPGPG
jgi:hypothetical protein